MWRPAVESDDPRIEAMCLELYREDPGESMSAAKVRRTLRALRDEPTRGKAVVAHVDQGVVGYALLAAFWSNEYGGEICCIDELYVEPAHRNRGIASRLFEAIATDPSLWSPTPAALQLETTPSNIKARALYERLGFRARNQLLRLRLTASA